MSGTQSQRINANCKIIWGNYDYDIESESDDWLHYMCHVKKDFGDSFGPPLVMTSLCYTSEGAYAELDRMLELWAKQVKRRTPMTKDENLEIFGGSKGEHKKLLGKVMDELEMREGRKLV